MRAIVLVSILFAGLPLASAQVLSEARQLSAEEMQQQLFGVHLFGTVNGGEIWNECIETDGDTLYTIGGRQERGKAWVSPTAKICFNYGNSLNHCFDAYEVDGELMFRGAGGSIWKTTKVREGVEVCLLNDMVS